MDCFRLDRLIGFFTSLHLAMGMLWIGLAAFTVGLAILMYSRWGQSQPLRKCMALSLLAHLLLAGYATTIEIVAPVPPPPVPVFHLSFCENAPPEDGTADRSGGGFSSRSQEQPWEAFPVEAVAQPVKSELDRGESGDPIEPRRAAVAEGDKLPGQPSLTQFPLVQVNPPDPKVASIDATEERPLPAESAMVLDAPAAERREAAAPGVPGIGIVDKQDTAFPIVQPARTSSESMPTALTQAPIALPKLPEDAMAAASKELPETLSNLQSDPTRLEPVFVRLAKPVADAAATEASDYAGRGSGTGGSAPGASSKLSTAPSNRWMGKGGDGGSGRQTALSGVAASAHGAPKLDRGGDAAEIDANEGVPDAYRLRVASNRTDVVRRQGGSPETETAVKAALKWLADNQAADGRWDPRAHGGGNERNLLGHTHENAGSHADTGITGLALLAFLAAGHTHRDGEYQDEVRRALEYLLQSQSPDGSLGGRGALYEFMYCHAMAACALSEAYGMTHDQRLREPVERAIAYSVAAQDPVGGGWRYRPGTPGDTSQLGWQLLALKSADLAGIPMPEPTRQGIIRFLRSVSSGKHGGRASYRPGEQVTRTMSAEALVCWQFLGMSRDDPAGSEAGDLILGDLPGDGIGNVYFWYYATLGMYQLQGIHWERWNEALQRTLVSRQNREGPGAGSWDIDELWGSHGGRVYTTALATLSLEVYYRFLPLYKGASANDIQAQRPSTPPQR